MEYSATEQEQDKWLITALATGGSFGEAEFKIETTSTARRHVVNPNSKRTFCGNHYNKKIPTTFIAAWLKTHNQEICYYCFNEAYSLAKQSNTALDDLEETVLRIADICIYAKKIKTKPPAKYSNAWQKAIECFNDAQYYRNSKEAGLQGILQNELLEAEEILKEYFLVHQGQISDTVFISTLLDDGRLCAVPQELLLLKTLNIEKKKELTSSEKDKIRAYIKSTGLYDLTKKIPDKTTLNQNNYNSFKDWVVAETVENELRKLEKICAAYFENLQIIRSSILKSSLSLIKIENSISYRNKVCDYLNSLEKVNKTSKNNGMLVPTKLIRLLKNTNNWPYGLTSLGVVITADTLEIFETALGLDLAPKKALKAARLLHKKT